MGCDGGTIPKRDELVKTKKKPEKNSKDVENAAKWNYCRLSQQTLQQPIVTDLLGYLYNKDAVIEFLLERSKYESGPIYLKNLKDVKELNLTPNPGYKIENADESSILNQTRWICPITGLEINGTYKMFCIFTCGCVISERAFKSTNRTEIGSKCLKCDKIYNPEMDLIVLNPNNDDLALNQEKFNLRKLAKKTQSKPNKNDVISNNSDKLVSITESKELSTIKLNSNLDTNDTTQKRPHNSVAETVKHEKNKSDVNTTAKKQKVSIQDDPNASNVFKSLFTTCAKAKNQQKSHWVTYNPQYF